MWAKSDLMWWMLLYKIGQSAMVTEDGSDNSVCDNYKKFS